MLVLVTSSQEDTGHVVVGKVGERCSECAFGRLRAVYMSLLRIRLGVASFLLWANFVHCSRGIFLFVPPPGFLSSSTGAEVIFFWTFNLYSQAFSVLSPVHASSYSMQH